MYRTQKYIFHFKRKIISYTNNCRTYDVGIENYIVFRGSGRGKRYCKMGLNAHTHRFVVHPQETYLCH